MDSSSHNSVRQMSATEAHNALQRGDYTLIDIRTPEEIDFLSIPGSTKLKLADLSEEKLQELGFTDKNQALIIQCRSGARSDRACQAMQTWGYTNVANLEGGILAWQEMGYETESK